MRSAKVILTALILVASMSTSAADAQTDQPGPPATSGESERLETVDEDPSPPPEIAAATTTSIFSATFSTPSRLYRVAPSGADTLIGEVRTTGGTAVRLTDIALSPTGRMYGASFDYLYRISRQDGSATLVGAFGFGGVNALTFATTGDLFAATLDGELLWVDPVLGAASLVFDFGGGVPSSGDLTADAEGHLYWTVQGSDDRLARLDYQSGDYLFIGNDLGVNEVFGLATGPTGILYGFVEDHASCGAGALVRINTKNGTSSFVRCLAFAPGGAASVPPEPDLTYVALGDSYASGEGAFDYLSATDVPLLNRCHRSRRAYAYEIADRLTRRAGAVSLTFRACSGAVIDDLLSEQREWEARPGRSGGQLQWLHRGVDLVTITIGGNDVKFAAVVRDCTVGFPCTGRDAGLDTDISRLFRRLLSTLEAVRLRAPHATIVLVGYPQILPDPAADPFGCLNAGPFGWSAAELDMARKHFSRLNYVMRKAADVAGVHFAAVERAFTEPDGTTHHICAGRGRNGEWAHGYVAGGLAKASFHPNQWGHQAMAPVVWQKAWVSSSRQLRTNPARDRSVHCWSQTPTMIGTPRSERIRGTKSGDVLLDFGGDDLIQSDDGDDFVCAGPGFDRVFSGKGNDFVRGGPNGDFISSSFGADVVFGEGGRDEINGGRGNDILRGQANNDILNGQSGTDTLHGGPGADTCLNGEILTACEA